MGNRPCGTPASFVHLCNISWAIASAGSPINNVAVRYRTEFLDVINPKASRDGEEPSAESESFVESIEISQDSDERLLGDVLRHVFSPGQAKQEVMK